MYPLAKDQFLAYEDKSYFLNIMQRSGQMPVSFTLILDDSFGVWFKKVLFCLSYPRETKLILSYRTLWVSEDIALNFTNNSIGTSEVTQLVANISSLYSPELVVGFTPVCPLLTVVPESS
jgi:hypothetical protein